MPYSASQSTSNMPNCTICNDSGVMIVKYAEQVGGEIVDQEERECICQRIEDVNAGYELAIDNALSN